MKRYLVFLYGAYYPMGGMYDFEKDFDTLEEAIEYAETHGGYGHVWDIKEGKEAYEKKGDGVRPIS